MKIGKINNPVFNSLESEGIKHDYQKVTASITDLARQVQGLNHRAVEQYQPVVEELLRTGCIDTRHIEHTLDGLLDFCGYPPVLQLYKRLCRHYWEINPVATASYINTYRELWDSEPEQKLTSREAGQ